GEGLEVHREHEMLGEVTMFAVEEHPQREREPWYEKEESVRKIMLERFGYASGSFDSVALHVCRATPDPATNEQRQRIPVHRIDRDSGHGIGRGVGRVGRIAWRCIFGTLP